MRRWIAAIVLLAVAGIALLIVALLPSPTRPIAAAELHDSADLRERGRYIAVTADCTACHTARGGREFSGGLPIASPVGTIYSTNITPDRKYGIGSYSLNEFDRAIRHGIAKSGQSLYPAMPYPSYSLLSDEDIVALYDYFMHGVAPVAVSSRENGTHWPLSLRWPVALWRKAFAPASDAQPFDASRYSEPAVARGAYLVQGAGHCGSCHTPRALTLQEKALSDSSALYLAGGTIVDGWVAVDLRGDAAEGLGSWSTADIIASLSTGRNAEQAVVGAPMRDVVVHSTQYLTDADRNAIAAYLKTLPASRDGGSTFVAPTTATALEAGSEAGRGAQVYVDNCAACHRSSGEGNRDVFPKIAGNPTVLTSNASSLIRLILAGSALPATVAAPSALGMPGFSRRLSNAEVAQLLTFIRSAWGNHAPGVTAEEVGEIRAAIGNDARAML